MRDSSACDLAELSFGTCLGVRCCQQRQSLALSLNDLVFVDLRHALNVGPINNILSLVIVLKLSFFLRSIEYFVQDSFLRILQSARSKIPGRQTPRPGRVANSLKQL